MQTWALKKKKKKKGKSAEKWKVVKMNELYLGIMFIIKASCLS